MKHAHYRYMKTLTLSFLCISAIACGPVEAGDVGEDDIVSQPGPAAANVPNRVSCWMIPFNEREVQIACTYRGPKIWDVEVGHRNGFIGGIDQPRTKLAKNGITIVGNALRSDFEQGNVAPWPWATCRNAAFGATSHCAAPVLSFENGKKFVSSGMYVFETGEPIQ